MKRNNRSENFPYFLIFAKRMYFYQNKKSSPSFPKKDLQSVDGWRTISLAEEAIMGRQWKNVVICGALPSERKDICLDPMRALHGEPLNSLKFFLSIRAFFF